MFVNQLVDIDDCLSFIQQEHDYEWVSCPPKLEYKRYLLKFDYFNRKSCVNTIDLTKNIQVTKEEFEYLHQEKISRIDSIMFRTGKNEGFVVEIIFFSGNVITIKHFDQTFSKRMIKYLIKNVQQREINTFIELS